MLVIAALLGLAGCSGGTNRAAATSANPPAIHWQGGSDRVFTTTAIRLEDDLPRTAQKLGWGVLRTVQSTEAGQPMLMMELLMPNERRMYAGVWPAGDVKPAAEVAAPYRVAVVGALAPHAAHQQKFLDALGAMLDGPPMKRRLPKFTLP